MVLGRFEEGAVGEDEGLEQRIAGQAVGAVQAGAGHLADGEESAQGGLALVVGFHASALVVGGGDDRNRLRSDVDPERRAGLVDFRETFLEEFAGLARDVEKDALGAGAFHFGVDGAGHDVARREIFECMVARHEGRALFVDQDASFAAHGFADEERFGFGMEKAGGVELDEFHVADGRTRAPGHGHAVAGGDVGIRCVEVNFATAASGQHDAVAAQGEDAAGFFVEHVDADHAVLGGVAEFARGDEVDGHVVFQHGDRRMFLDGGHEGFFDFEPGEVVGVENAALGVSAFATEIEFGAAVGFFAQVEGHAEFDQFANPLGAFAHDEVDDVLVAQSRPGLEGVFDVEFERILRAGHASHAALGPRRVGRGFGAFRHHRDGAVRGGFERVGQAGDAGAEDDVVKLLHDAARAARCR